MNREPYKARGEPFWGGSGAFCENAHLREHSSCSSHHRGASVGIVTAIPSIPATASPTAASSLRACLSAPCDYDYASCPTAGISSTRGPCAAHDLCFPSRADRVSHAPCLRNPGSHAC